MTRPLNLSGAGTMVRHGGLALAGGLVGGLGEWAGMPQETVALMVVLTVTLGATALFFRGSN